MQDEPVEDDVDRPSIPSLAAVSDLPPVVDKPEPSSGFRKFDMAIVKLLHGNLWWSVLRFGIPLVAAMGLHTTFNLVDIFLISRLPNATEALAAVAICDMIAALATIVSNGLSNASVAILSRRLGKRDSDGVSMATCQSLIVVGGLSIIFGVVGIAASGWIIREAVHVPGEAGVLATRYLAVTLGGSFSIFFLLQITAILRGLGSSKLPAFLLIGGNVLNLLLAVLLIYGPGPGPDLFAWMQPVARTLGIPHMGLEGAAWATIIGRTVPCIAGALALAFRPGRRVLKARFFKPVKAEIMRLIRLGWPSSAQLVVRVLAIVVVQSIVAREFSSATDQSALAAYGICLRLETMALFVGLGWGAAASTFMGANLGAKQPDRASKSGWIASVYNIGLMLLLTAFYLGLSGPILRFFDPSHDVVAVGQEYLSYVAPTYALVGLGAVISQALTGAGATLSSFVLDAIVLLAIQIPVAIVATAFFDLPRTGLWIILALGNVVSAAAYILWYRRGSFLHTHVA